MCTRKRIRDTETKYGTLKEAVTLVSVGALYGRHLYRSLPYRAVTRLNAAVSFLWELTIQIFSQVWVVPFIYYVMQKTRHRLKYAIIMAGYLL